MGDAVERLTKKVDPDHVALTRIFIPPYIRLREGQIENVDGYFREIGSLQDLTSEERAAIPPDERMQIARALSGPQVGDRVIVSHDLGDEEGTVISAGAADPRVTVRFDDGTESSWGRARVSKAPPKPRLEVTDEGIFDVTGQPDLNPPDLPGGNLPTAPRVPTWLKPGKRVTTPDGKGNVIGPVGQDATEFFVDVDGIEDEYAVEDLEPADAAIKELERQLRPAYQADLLNRRQEPPHAAPGGNLPTRAEPGTIGAVLEVKARAQRPPAEDLTPSGHRPLNRIAGEIYADWKQPNFAAKPYLEALSSLRDIRDQYGYDSATSVVAYFLSNASSWRGPKAKEIKAELKDILKKNKNVPFIGTQNF